MNRLNHQNYTVHVAPIVELIKLPPRLENKNIIILLIDVAAVHILFSVLILQGQYEFCYKTVLEFLVSFDTYANFK